MKSVKAIFIDSNSYKQIGEWGGGIAPSFIQ